jgi:hypothetical protein
VQEVAERALSVVDAAQHRGVDVERVGKVAGVVGCIVDHGGVIDRRRIAPAHGSVLVRRAVGARGGRDE